MVIGKRLQKRRKELNLSRGDGSCDSLGNSKL